VRAAVLAETEVEATSQRREFVPSAVVAAFGGRAATSVGRAPGCGGVLVAVAIAGCASAAWVAAEGFRTVRHLIPSLRLSLNVMRCFLSLLGLPLNAGRSVNPLLRAVLPNDLAALV
jgi:hypothetical protein